MKINCFSKAIFPVGKLQQKLVCHWDITEIMKTILKAKIKIKFLKWSLVVLQELCGEILV